MDHPAPARQPHPGARRHRGAGEAQALAFEAVLGVGAVRLYDVDAEAVARAWANLEGRGLGVTCAGSAAEAVRGADILTTATADKARATILTPGMVEPGQHLDAIGGDCPGETELHPGILEAARVFAESEPQTRIEGEIQQLPAHFPVTELWRVLGGHAPGRTGPSDVTAFDPVGFALEDSSALRCVRDLAGAGADLDLIPEPADPGDLFGAMLGRGRALDRAA